MDEATRIQKDLDMFKDNLKKLQSQNPAALQQQQIKMAVDYYNDARYYFEKKDYFTAFGCINYGHGLLDSLFKFTVDPNQKL
ncbi:MAG: DUF357 domain-containing protein [Candidatus Thermoplasmatota archaeon]|nr:DUF357 domain-containing protein [Candidatus Thermoplasmatota archaeon]